MNKEELQLQIDTICSELKEATSIISALDPVSHLGKSKFRFYGGIIGAIQEIREDRRLEKLANIHIYKNYTFYSFAYYLRDITSTLINAQIAIQECTSKDDDCYYGNALNIIENISVAFVAWYSYSPDMATSISSEAGEGVSLALYLDIFIKEAFRQMDLPEGITIEDSKEESNSGCFGVIMIFIICGTALFALL